MRRYFNDNEAFVCDWLSNLWPEAHVDRRSIADIQPAELVGYDRAHFFAGIGGWEYALSLAGWPADRPVWTGSCPCQPFSAAGKQQGEADARHLWPEFRRLIAKRRPPVVFGEQVASRLGREWLAGVRADLEALGYAVGAADLCAAGVGAPHIRQRLYWGAYAQCGRRQGGAVSSGGAATIFAPPDGNMGGMADASGVGHQRRGDAGIIPSAAADPESQVQKRQRRGDADSDCGATGGLGHPNEPGPQGWLGGELPECAGERATGPHGPCGPDYRVADSTGAGQLRAVKSKDDRTRLSWRSATDAEPGGEGVYATRYCWNGADEWLTCLDGKTRRIESGVFPLAHGIPARVGRLRAYGNAIVPQAAAAFVTAFMEATGIVAVRSAA